MVKWTGSWLVENALRGKSGEVDCKLVGGEDPKGIAPLEVGSIPIPPSAIIGSCLPSQTYSGQISFTPTVLGQRFLGEG